MTLHPTRKPHDPGCSPEEIAEQIAAYLSGKNRDGSQKVIQQISEGVQANPHSVDLREQGDRSWRVKTNG
jgi:hypothetical protein